MTLCNREKSLSVTNIFPVYPVLSAKEEKRVLEWLDTIWLWSGSSHWSMSLSLVSISLNWWQPIFNFDCCFSEIDASRWSRFFRIDSFQLKRINCYQFSLTYDSMFLKYKYFFMELNYMYLCEKLIISRIKCV